MKKQEPALRWLRGVAGKDKKKIGLLLLIQAVLGAAGVVFALGLRGLIDAASAGRSEGLRLCALGLGALVLGQIALRALQRLLRENCVSALENRYKRRLFGCLLRKDYASVTAVHSGEWMNRLCSDTAVVSRNMTELLPKLGGMAVRLLCALTAVILLEPLFAAALLPAGLLLLALSYGFRRLLKRLHSRVQEKDGALRAFLQERLGSLLVLRSFGVEARSEELAAQRMDAHREARLQRSRLVTLCTLGFSIAMQGAYVAAAVCCAWGLLKGTMSTGTLVAILQLVVQIQEPFANLSGLVPEYYAMLASAERLMEAEAYPPDGAPPRPREEVRDFYRNDLQAICLQDVSFRYASAGEESTPPVLEGLNLRIRKGEFVALTGRSGCGKSTLLRLLMSIYPLEKGRRLLETASGQRELDASWRGLFAYVPQGNQLFSGTVREILRFGGAGDCCSEEDLRRALRIACAEQFLPDLDRTLGEGGTGLSEGQRQRLAIARAIASGRPVLLLDEATAALDGETERQLLENLRSMTDRTVLLVTHRPAAFAVCDRQISLE